LSIASIFVAVLPTVELPWALQFVVVFSQLFIDFVGLFRCWLLAYLDVQLELVHAYPQVVVVVLVQVLLKAGHNNLLLYAK
jgi:hypothetical protein